MKQMSKVILSRLYYMVSFTNSKDIVAISFIDKHKVLYL